VILKFVQVVNHITSLKMALLQTENNSIFANLVKRDVLIFTPTKPIILG
jgi:hypothetical protein